MSEATQRDYKGLNDRGWICDRCGEIIHRAEDGWVQWHTPYSKTREGYLEEKRAKGQDLQLVHHVPASPLPTKRGVEFGCQFGNEPGFTVSDSSLTNFVGPNGLMCLLAFIAEDRIQKEEVLEMIKRLNIPGYEHTRLHFDSAIRDGVFEPNTLPGYYRQSNIKAVESWLKDRE